MTLGRAIRLAQMMALDRIDEESTMADYPNLHVPLPSASNFAEKEERRRAFWALFVFDTFAGIRTNGISSIHGSGVSSLRTTQLYMCHELMSSRFLRHCPALANFLASLLTAICHHYIRFHTYQKIPNCHLSLAQ